jgi:hypothetical protein
MGVDHGRCDVAVAEQLLHGPDVVAVLQEVCGERVPESVAGRALRDPGRADRVMDRALDHGLVQVMAPALAGLAIDVDAGGGEDPLPGPFTACTGVLAAEGSGELDPPGAAAKITIVEPPDALEVALQGLAGDPGSMVTQSLSPLPPRTTI